MTVQLAAGQSRNDQNINISGIPVVGGDQPGQNLVLRSTSSNSKGSVLLDEVNHSHSPFAGALTVPNGSIGIGGNVVSGGYNIMMPVGLSVTGYVVLAGGSSYSTITPPNVIFSPPDIPNCITAQGVAQISGGAVVGITVTVPGTGYIKVPTVTFQAAVGSGANATAILGYTSMLHAGCIHQTGYVQSIIVNSGGTAYGSTNAIPTVTISKPDIPGGIQATAVLLTSQISAGVIQPAGINVTNPGSGYLYPPTVTFSNGAATAVAYLGNPGVKPIVTQVGTPTSNAYTLDFGLTGHNVVYMTSGTNSTINFDATRGFPMGRQIVVYFKSTGATSLTLTGFTAGNSSTGSATITLTNARTTRLEFNVLTGNNSLADVFVHQIG